MQEYPTEFRRERFDIYLEKDGNRIRNIDYLELDHIIRDISFIRAKSKKSKDLDAGQLYVEMFQLPYWDFLFVKGYLQDHEIKDLQDGCLLMTAMFLLQAFEELEEDEIPVIFQNNNLEKILEALYYHEPVDEIQKETIRKLFYLSRHLKDEKVVNWEPDNPEVELIRNEISACNKWLYTEYVVNYFIDAAAELIAVKE